MKTKLGLALIIALCTPAFALLMAMRDEVHSVWARAALAAGAFVVMGLLLGIVAARKRPDLVSGPK